MRINERKFLGGGKREEKEGRVNPKSRRYRADASDISRPLAEMEAIPRR